jgi:hypothetical protein
LGGHGVSLPDLEKRPELKQFPHMRKHLPRALLVVPLLATLVACGSRDPAPAVPGIAELVEDPILLSRVLERCNSNPSLVSSLECTNARAASDRRLAADRAAQAAKAEAGFERAREARRRAEEAAKQSREALEKRVSPYDLPVEGAEEKPSAAP